MEAGADDPVVVAPWASPDASCAFVDLRRQPERVDAIAEAQQWPELRIALLLLNAKDGATWTAKCDAWVLSPEEKARVADELGCDAAEGLGCYMDVLLANQAQRSDFHAHEEWAKALARDAERTLGSDVFAELMVRHALVEGTPGFALTAYLFAVGSDMRVARRHWGESLRWLVGTMACGSVAAGSG